MVNDKLPYSEDGIDPTTVELALQGAIDEISLLNKYLQNDWVKGKY